MSADMKNQPNHTDESHSHPEPMTYFKVALALVALTALEVLIAFLQAYVFTILTCLYLNEAINLH